MGSDNTVQARIVLQGEVASINGLSDGVAWEVGFLGDEGLLPLTSDLRRGIDLTTSLDGVFEQADELVHQFFHQRPRWYPLDNSGLLWAANLLFDMQSTPN